jgi:hypothetical protein
MQLNKSIIAMIHVAALPGTPNNRLPVGEIIRQAVTEAKIFQDHGADALMIENMHDRPYLNRKVGPEITAAMTAVATAVRQAVSIPVGIQILAGANREALAVALASGLGFIRAEGFVFGHLADEGFMDSDAGELLRYRKAIGAEHIRIFTDIRKKHSSHAVTADISIEETAQAAEFFLSDGLIVTGSSTGEEPDAGEVESVKAATALPVIIGSGITAANLEKYWPLADAFIVGSSLKKEGKWFNPPDQERVSGFMESVRKLKQSI